MLFCVFLRRWKATVILGILSFGLDTEVHLFIQLFSLDQVPPMMLV